MLRFARMDEPTLRAYDSHAREFADRYERVAGGISAFFPQVFRAGMRVLDIGCGSGRDVARLTELGCDAWGMEPSSRLLEEAVRHHPNLRERLLAGGLPDELGVLAGRRFDGIVLSAVLMHIPDEQLFNSAVAIRELLTDGGRLLVSVPVSRPTLDPESRREADGRLFRIRGAAELRLLFERLGLQLQSEWESDDALGRTEVQWTTLIFHYDDARSRPIDRIEAIINRDNKTATYKLALLRALADIAQTSEGLVSHQRDGLVAVPMQAVVDRWIEYYWGFVERDQPIAQNWNGKDPAFWGQLRELAQHYREMNGFAGFRAHLRAKAPEDLLPATIGASLKSLRSKLRATIIKGPIQHAGDSEFAYADGSVLVSPDLWTEMVLMGHWIEDSIVLRWTDLTAQRTRTPVGDILPLLVSRHEDPRMDADARRIYVSAGAIAGVWTGRPLRGTTFDVDHIIPFALRRDSSLWNLVPETRAANNNKRDRLPTLRLLTDSRERIVESWKLLHGTNPERFISDATRLARGLQPDNWEAPLFTALSEAIEATATLRGVERWAG